MQPVRPAIQPLVFLGIRQVEDIALIDNDLADYGVGALEYRVFGNSVIDCALLRIRDAGHDQ